MTSKASSKQKVSGIKTVKITPRAPGKKQDPENHQEASEVDALPVLVDPTPERKDASEQQHLLGKNIHFKKIDDVLKDVANHSSGNTVLLVGFGVSWSFACRKSLKHLLHFGEAAIARSRKLKVFFVDEDANRDFCKKSEIIAGTPVIMAFCRGKEMMFSRGEWEPMNKLKGLVNVSQLEELWSSIQAALEMGAHEIHVAF